VSAPGSRIPGLWAPAAASGRLARRARRLGGVAAAARGRSSSASRGTGRRGAWPSRRRSGARAAADPSGREAAERLGELARDHEDLVRLALASSGSICRYWYESSSWSGSAVVDRAEDGLDRLGLALGAQDRRGAGALRLEDRGLLLALGGEDLRLLDALGGEDRGAAVALGAHLLLHRLLDRARAGSTDLSSTRLTRIPHLPVASSRTTRSCVLIWSRLVSVSSSVSPPITLRSVVTVSCSMPAAGWRPRRSRLRVGDVK
jgi:hypothetical protein